jgi:large conductance mechanosensitive channel
MLAGIKGLIGEFKAFALQGNVMDLAVGLVIGSAFTTIVTSLVKNVMMPPLGLLMGGVDFSNKMITLRAAKLDPADPTGTKVLVPATNLSYGLFINNIIDFLIVAAAVFMVVKLINTAKKKPVAGPPTTKECPKCLSTIPIKATKCAHCTTDLPATA